MDQILWNAPMTNSELPGICLGMHPERTLCQLRHRSVANQSFA